MTSWWKHFLHFQMIMENVLPWYDLMMAIVPGETQAIDPKFTQMIIQVISDPHVKFGFSCYPTSCYSIDFIGVNIPKSTKNYLFSLQFRIFLKTVLTSRKEAIWDPNPNYGNFVRGSHVGVFSIFRDFRAKVIFDLLWFIAQMSCGWMAIWGSVRSHPGVIWGAESILGTQRSIRGRESAFLEGSILGYFLKIENAGSPRILL